MRELPADLAVLDGLLASAFHEFPVGVLAGDLVALELEQVAAPDLDPVALGGRPGEQPLRAAPVAADPVTVLAVVDVGEAGEPACQPRAYLLPSLEPPAPGMRDAGSSRTGSSAKKLITASRSWALKASTSRWSVSTVTLPVPVI